jgi:membrane dipeptidase
VPQRWPRVLDGHNDALLSVRKTGRSLLERSGVGHLDVPRALEAGFAGGFFAVFVRSEGYEIEDEVTVHESGWEVAMAPPVPQEEALAEALATAAVLLRAARESGGALRVARSVAEVEACVRDGSVGAILHFEGAEPIDTDLAALEVLYAAGLRSLGITWSRPNAFATGVPFAYPRSPDTGPGLTQAGRALVEACNRLGIMLDLSHLNERGFWDVAELSVAPLVATHSGVHAICPSTRNLTDRQLQAIAASGGLVGITFTVSDLRPDGGQEPEGVLRYLVDHVVYVAELVGVEHVALGSDFDGAPMPAEVADVTGLPRLLSALAERGVGPGDLQAIAHGNWLRVLRATWR